MEMLPLLPLPSHERAFERDGSGDGAGVQIGDQGVGDDVGIAFGVEQHEVDGVGVQRRRPAVRQGDDEDVASRADSGGEKRQDALYSEMQPGGYLNVIPNNTGEESQLNIEALFNAVLRNKNIFKEMFK